MCTFSHPGTALSHRNKQEAKSHFSFGMCAFSPPNFPMNTERALTQNCPVPTVLRVSYHPARTSLQFSKNKSFFHLKIRLRALSARRFFKRCYSFFLAADEGAGRPPKPPSAPSSANAAPVARLLLVEVLPSSPGLYQPWSY